MTAKIRNPLGPIGLGIITLGIYTWVWWYNINREMVDLGHARQTTELGEGPSLSVLAFIFGGYLLLIPYVWTIVGTSRRIMRAQNMTGVRDQMNGWFAGLLWVLTFGIGGIIYTQVHMNKVWRTSTHTYSTAASEVPVTANW